MSAALDPVTVLRALAAELPSRSNLGREFAYHARRLVFHDVSLLNMRESLDGYAQVSEALWTPDERAAFALAREALAACIKGGAP